MPPEQPRAEDRAGQILLLVPLFQLVAVAVASERAIRQMVVQAVAVAVAIWLCAPEA